MRERGSILSTDSRRSGLADAEPTVSPDAADTAVVGRRVVQFVIDYLICVAVPLPLLGIFLLADTNADGGLVPNGQFWALVVLYIAISVGWRSLWVWVWRPARAGGRTYGMSMLGLRIARQDGGPVTVGPVAIRAALLPVDLMVSGVVGLVTMLASTRHQRIGDLAANTLVVRDRESAGVRPGDA